jgi:hypothetical protein
VEQRVEATKTALGRAQDAVRQSPGWHRHRLTALLAPGFLWHRKMRWGKTSPRAAGVAPAHLLSGAPPLTHRHGSRGPRAGGVGPAGPSPGLAVAQQASYNGGRNRPEQLMYTPKLIFGSLQKFASAPVLASCLMSCLAQGRRIPSEGGVVPTDRRRPLPRVAGAHPHACACSTERGSLPNGRSAEQTRGPQQRRAATSGPRQSKG